MKYIPHQWNKGYSLSALPILVLLPILFWLLIPILIVLSIDFHEIWEQIIWHIKEKIMSFRSFPIIQTIRWIYKWRTETYLDSLDSSFPSLNTRNDRFLRMFVIFLRFFHFIYFFISYIFSFLRIVVNLHYISIHKTYQSCHQLNEYFKSN